MAEGKAEQAGWVLDTTSSGRPTWSHAGAGLWLTYIERGGADVDFRAGHRVEIQRPPEPQWLLTVMATPAGTGILDRAWFRGTAPLPIDPDVPRAAIGIPDDVIDAVEAWLCAGSSVGWVWGHRVKGGAVVSLVDGDDLGIAAASRRMHQVIRLRLKDLHDRGRRTRAEDAGPSAFDVAAADAAAGAARDVLTTVTDDRIEKRDDTPPSTARPDWLLRFDAVQIAAIEALPDFIRPVLRRMANGTTTDGDILRVVRLAEIVRNDAIRDAGAAIEAMAAPPPTAIWWGFVAHEGGTQVGGLCSWETNAAGVFLRVDVPAIALPAAEALYGEPYGSGRPVLSPAMPEYTVDAHTVRIAASRVISYNEHTEEYTREWLTGIAEGDRRQIHNPSYGIAPHTIVPYSHFRG